MVINVLRNDKWYQIDSSKLEHVTHGLYVFHFKPKEPIYQKITNTYEIFKNQNVFKFGSFSNGIHDKLQGINGYTKLWRFLGSESDILTDKSVDSYSFEDSTKRYLIFDASKTINILKQLESIFMESWKCCMQSYFLDSNYYFLVPMPSEEEFLKTVIQCQTKLHNFAINNK